MRALSRDALRGPDLALERVAAGVRAHDLARVVGVSRQRITAIEHSTRVPKATVARYVSALIVLTGSRGMR